MAAALLRDPLKRRVQEGGDHPGYVVLKEQPGIGGPEDIAGQDEEAAQPDLWAQWPYEDGDKCDAAENNCRSQARNYSAECTCEAASKALAGLIAVCIADYDTVYSDPAARNDAEGSAGQGGKTITTT